MATSGSGSSLEKNYELHEGIITIGNKRFRAPELLFNPIYVGRNCCGIQQLITDSAHRCNIDIQKPLLENIVLSGGSTLFPGFAARVQEEVSKLAPI